MGGGEICPWRDWTSSSAARRSESVGKMSLMRCSPACGLYRCGFELMAWMISGGGEVAGLGGGRACAGGGPGGGGGDGSGGGDGGAGGGGGDGSAGHKYPWLQSHPRMSATGWQPPGTQRSTSLSCRTQSAVALAFGRWPLQHGSEAPLPPLSTHMSKSAAQLFSGRTMVGSSGC